MAQATTFNEAANMNREQILDVLSIVAPERTPLFSTLPKIDSASSLLVEWGAEGLANPKFDGVVDGTDVESFKNKAETRAKISNRIQTFTDPYMVSRQQEMVATAGVVGEFDHAKAKAMTEHNISIESALGSDNEANSGDGTTAALLRGFGKFADDTNTNIPSVARMPAASSGTTSTLTESGYNAVLQSVYESSGESLSFRQYSGPTLQNKITGFTRSEGSVTSTPLSVNETAASKALTYSIVRYMGDFGNVDIIPDLFLGRTSDSVLTTAGKQRGYLVPTDTAFISFLQSPVTEEFEDKGGGQRGRIISDLTLCVKNSRALGKFSG